MSGGDWARFERYLAIAGDFLMRGRIDLAREYCEDAAIIRDSLLTNAELAARRGDRA
ncbi:hypothetical protein [Agromyces archimandritae]|uniref:Uncharacterized protein n=1 Tax=Agromyces archimandritae TaxID=2781962 RepID=A0A975IPK4_9MICO|nr:hypothetical protein [Agromyces archimandritae]QTX04101.1 hypothetical protein G127AT_12480 [Agromyces archimandritae]